AGQRIEQGDAGGAAGGGRTLDWVREREVTREVGGRRKANAGGRRRLRCLQALVSREGEELVAEDGAAEGATELVLMQGVRNGGEEVAGVDVVVAEELERVAVEAVGTGAGDGVDLAAGVDAILRAEHARLDGELVQSVGEREGHVDIGRVVGVVAAVKTPDGAVTLATVDGDGDGLVAVFGAGEVAARGWRSTTGEGDEAGDLARSGVERKLGNLALVDGLLELGVLRLQG